MAFALKAVLPLLLLGHLAQGSLWVLNFQTADKWMAGFIGDVTVCLHFRSPNATRNTTDLANSSTPLRTTAEEDCQDVPWRNFQRGTPYIFAVEFSEGLALEKARVFARQAENTVCQSKAVDTWHIQHLAFQSMETGLVFQAGNETTDPLLVHSRCGRSDELLLDDFSVSTKRRPCVVDGVIYKDGEDFEHGCSGKCKCKDADFSCVSLCPPSMAIGCRRIYVPGQCCPAFICEKQRPVACPVYESSDCETANRTVEPGEYPWAAFIKLCNKNGCHRFCSGALLSDRWILTAAECLFWADDQPVKPEQMRVIVGEQTLVLDEDRDVEMAVANVTLLQGNGRAKSSFGMVRLKDEVGFDRTVQPAVLPLSREQCSRLVQPGCGLSMTGWVHVGTPDAEQYELYKLSTQIEKSASCTPTMPSNSSRKSRPPPPTPPKKEHICLNLANDDPIFQPECDNCHLDANATEACFADKTAYLCTGEKGRALVSKVQVSGMEVNYLVGITSYRLRVHESPKGLCKMQAYELAVNLCHDLHGISEVINTYQ